MQDSISDFIGRIALVACATLAMASGAKAQDAIFRASMDVPSCADIQYNSGLFVAPFPATWQDVYGNLPFPNPLGTARNISVPAGGVVSLSFTPSASIPHGFLETAESPGQPGGPLTISISTCRGDFRREALANQETLCMSLVQTSQASLTFVTGLGTNASFCGLTLGQTYYINIAHVETHVDGQPTHTCGSANCSTLLRALSLSR